MTLSPRLAAKRNINKGAVAVGADSIADLNSAAARGILDCDSLLRMGKRKRTPSCFHDPADNGRWQQTEKYVYT